MTFNLTKTGTKILQVVSLIEKKKKLKFDPQENEILRCQIATDLPGCSTRQDKRVLQMYIIIANLTSHRKLCSLKVRAHIGLNTLTFQS